MLSLRYDLPVPFARFIAMHNTGNIKVRTPPPPQRVYCDFNVALCRDVFWSLCSLSRFEAFVFCVCAGLCWTVLSASTSRGCIGVTTPP